MSTALRSLSILAFSGCFCLPATAADPVDVTSGSGANIHFTDPRPGELEMMKAAGFKWVRMDFAWQGTEREKGVYDFSAYDRLMESLTRQGIRAYFILDYSNSLYEPLGSVRSDAGRDAYTAWAVAAVSHFKGRGIWWEIWNEPNGGFWPPQANAAEYTAMAVKASAAIRKACPDENLAGPATSTIDMPFLKACFDAGLKPHWQAWSVHPYRQGGPESVADEYAAVRRLASRYAPQDEKITILSGEWGYSSAWNNIDPDLQGRMLPRQWLVNAANDIPISIWYDWKDDGPDPKEPEHHFGTVEMTYHEGRDPVFDPKPAYLAARTYNQILSGFHFVKRIALGDDQDQALLFEKDQRQVLAVWTTAASEREIRLPSDDGSFPVKSHLGVDLPGATASGGEISLKVDSGVRYLSFEGRNARLSAAAEAWPVHINAAAAGADFVHVRVENLSDHRISGRIVLDPIDGLSVY